MPSLGFDLGTALGADDTFADDAISFEPETDAAFVVGGAKMRTIYITQGDLLPPIQAIAFNENERIDCTAFETITFRMWSGSTVKEGAATGDADGNLQYELADGDTGTVGEYEAVFIGVDSEGRTQTIPTPNRLTVVIVEAPPEAA